MVDAVQALVAGQGDTMLRRIGALSNVAALLNERLDRINWVGFYLTDESGETLVLGPFQGKVACSQIPFGRGVCGTAAATRQSQRVADVHDFAGHIVCDHESLSELVIPLIDGHGMVVGVLDIDSPMLDRFSEADERLLCEVVSVVTGALYP